MLEKAIRALPALSEASESNKIAMFSQGISTELDNKDAWEYLDPLLNHFLGFNRTVESIFKVLHGGEKGLAGMIQYLKEFVSRYQINKVLLKGKVERLVHAFQIW
jgi:hypothetical protein